MRLIWLMINVVIWTMLLGTLGIIVSIFEHRGRFMSWVAITWSKIILMISGVPISVVGLENLDPNGHYIFAGNHESAFDIPLSFAGLPYQMVSIAKVELRKIPFFGWAMRAGKHIFVNRKDHEKARASLKEAKLSLKNNPRSILLFPEGTRSLDGKIHTFKKGGLALAIETGIPVVPIAMCGTSEVVTKGTWNINPRPIELRVGKPIQTESLEIKDRKLFTEQVRQSVIDLKEVWKSIQ
ncbi:MAG: 1-acyl-sn-glycerol-3-phosphate acyltransferase [Candidatus Marinimicrobia bacterium]|nr:1-acyl-sn-glycerol-3-phosphate acyltransferase [Candidatus Neomarinimicrobiota bacterium]